LKRYGCGATRIRTGGQPLRILTPSPLPVETGGTISAYDGEDNMFLI
jgi:hypothetical protein